MFWWSSEIVRRYFFDESVHYQLIHVCLFQTCLSLHWAEEFTNVSMCPLPP